MGGFPTICRILVKLADRKGVSPSNVLCSAQAFASTTASAGDGRVDIFAARSVGKDTRSLHVQ